MLEEEHGVGVANGSEQQALGIVRARRDHDLQARRCKACLDRLGVVERAMDVAAHRGSDHDRNAPVAIRAVTELGDLVRDLVEGHVREVRELDLGHRPLAGQRHSQRNAGD